MIKEKFNKEIDSLIEKMTLKEKVGQLNQKLYGWKCLKKTSNGYELTDYFKNHIQEYGGVGAIYGLLRADMWSGMNEVIGVKKEDSAKIIDMIQDYIKEHTKLKIPALISEECIHGHVGLHTPMTPANISMGATWNPYLLEKLCSNVANDLSSKKGNLALYSSLDILREPRWGRTEECFSEDPYLTSVFTKSAVQGFQKENFKDGVGIVLKHLCAQGACVGGHNSGAANIGNRELREIFLPPVKAGVESGAISFMAAYNEIDGIPCHTNHHLLTEILRDEYQFDGIVMADGCALDRLISMTNDKAKAAALALQAGVDLSLWDDIYCHLDEAVKKEYISEEILNQSVRRILKVKQKLGLLNNSITHSKSLNYNDINLQAARECQVLLKNDTVLPLQKKGLKIVVIGPNAHARMHQLGDYTSFQKDEEVITLLEGIQKIAPDNVVSYALGCQIRGNDKQYLEEAVKLAKNSDVVILALGGSSARDFKMEFEANGAVKTSYNKSQMNCGENVDMANLQLDGIQELLIQEISKVNQNIITVLIQGRPHVINNAIEASKAVLCSWYPGNQGGQATAEILFGDYNPNGKLAVSLPRSSAQLPCFYNGKTEGVKEDYVDMLGKPLYPFGYGLSYTQYEYKDIQISKSEIPVSKLQEKGIDITLIVKNTGGYDGYEVVQVYIIDQESRIVRRDKELKGFTKVFVKAHSQTTVSIHLPGDSFAIWDYQMKHVIEKGTVKVLIGPNSEEYQIKTLKII
ncbi:MAG: glycoside hydrolase family 3 N-terminal domain-containing protein [Coprobacillaceae bacterium]